MTIKKTAKIKLEGLLSIKNIDTLKEKLDEGLAQKKDIVFDAAKLERIDTACLQLIAAFTKKQHENSYSVAWSKPSDEIIEIAKLLDFKEAIAL